jgi:hypothetical protein
VALGTSRCPRGSVKQDVEIQPETTPKTCTRIDLKTLRSKTHRVGGAVHPQCLGELPVADPPTEDVLRASHHLRLGDLALCDPSGVALPPVLTGRMGPVLERLDEVATEGDGLRGAGQALSLELLQVVQQGLELLGVPRCKLVGPFRTRDRHPPCPLLQSRCGVVQIELPLLPASGVVEER